MKNLCKICPQSAVCAAGGSENFGDIWDTHFYPQRIESWRKDTVVFRCYAPYPTGESDESNGGGSVDVFRVPVSTAALQRGKR